jgi:hypothetical protein
MTDAFFQSVIPKTPCFQANPRRMTDVTDIFDILPLDL